MTPNSIHIFRQRKIWIPFKQLFKLRRKYTVAAASNLSHSPTTSLSCHYLIHFSACYQFPALFFKAPVFDQPIPAAMRASIPITDQITHGITDEKLPEPIAQS